MKAINLQTDPKHLRQVKQQQWTGAKDDRQVHILKELKTRSTVINSSFIHHGMRFPVHQCCSSLDATNNHKEWHKGGQQVLRSSENQKLEQRNLKCEGQRQCRALNWDRCVSETGLQIVNPGLCCYYDYG